MLIAREKKESNIIEYILYMYQIEDIIRSLKMDIDLIEKHIISQFDQPIEIKQEIKNWYLNLISEMKIQNKERAGHLNGLLEEIDLLQSFHTKLLTAYQDDSYKVLYQKAKPILVELVKKSGGANLVNEIDVALTGVYGLLVLRLKGTEISESTAEAMLSVNKLLAHLSFQYHKNLKGELNLKESFN